MEPILLFIEGNQVWIYLLLLVAGLVYLRLTAKRLQEVRRAIFGLERERALGRLTRSSIMLGLSVTAAGSVFVVTTLVYPAIPASARATPFPTVPPGENAQAGPTLSAPGAAATASWATPPGVGGCDDPNLELAFPESGDVISGTVVIRGTVNTPGFAFYKFEHRSVAPDAIWQTILAGTSTVVDGDLGVWETSLVEPGVYDFRLVATDTEGNESQPCVVQVTIVPTDEND